MRPGAPTGTVGATVGEGIVVGGTAVGEGIVVGGTAVGEGVDERVDGAVDAGSVVGLAVGATAPEQAENASAAISVVTRRRRMVNPFGAAPMSGAYSSDDPAVRRVGVKFAPTQELS
jgi:hypothetical protein